MKNKLLLGAISLGVLLQSTSVFALTGNATVDFTGKDTVEVGETFTVKMNIKDVTGTTDGIVSFDGNLVFDQESLEFVDSNSRMAPYYFDMNNDANYRFAGLDFSLNNGILENTTVYEFTFKALKEGNTNITLNNYKLTDTQDYINTTVVAKNINIKNTEVLEPVVVEEEKVVETNEEVKEVRTAKVETVAKKEVKKPVIENKKVDRKQEIMNKLEVVANNLFKKIIKMFK